MSLGPIDRKELLSFDWYPDAYKKTTYPPEDLVTLKRAAPDLEVKAFIGTWCGDTHDQLPPFMKLLDMAGIKKVSIIALDRSKTYPGFINEFGIVKIPTLIVFKNGKELGRITETPTTTLLNDLTGFLLP